MIKIFLLSILLLFSCSQKKKPYYEKLIQDYMIMNVYMKIQPETCRNSYGQPNLLLNYNEYYEKIFNRNTYNTLIFGDSTMDISVRYVGFLSSTSFSYAIGGNTACDVLEQLDIVNAKTSYVVYSTNDGNGGLRSIDNHTIRVTNNQVIAKIKARLNPTKIVVILLHPTRLLKFDDNRKIINDNFINDNQDVCNILPDELFTIENDGRASMDNMIDSIHYNKDISFGIKRLIKEKCGVEL